MKPITRQLTIAALILASVTVLSFGIRQVRFSIYRAKNIENSIVAEAGETTASARSSNRKDQSQPKQLLGANAEPGYYLDGSYTVDIEPDYYPDDSYTVDIEPEPKNANVSDSDNEAPSKTKSFKGGYARSEGKNDLGKISLGDNENLYRTEKGELWYVSKEADGSTTKMQVQADGRGGMNIISGGNYAQSGASKGLQRISVGNSEDIYLTGEGEAWYVGQQPDGSTAKVQIGEDIVGELNIVNDDKDE